MANGRRFLALRQYHQFLEHEIYMMRQQLQVEGTMNHASGQWLSGQIEEKQKLYDEIDFVLDRYGSEVEIVVNRWQTVMVIAVAVLAFVLSLVALIS